MMATEQQTLIIGAGIAGLACARTLADAGAPFSIIAEDVGGRIRTSEDGAVNYGAALVSDDYDHVLPWVTKGERLRMGDLRFYRDGPGYPLLGVGLLRYGLQPLRLVCELRRFREAYRRFRRRSEHVSQKQAIETDPYLDRLYHTRASDLREELRIVPLCHRYLCQGLYPLVFATPEDINAFLYLHFLQPLIVPMHFFTFQLDALVEPFADRIQRGTVTAIEEADGAWRVRADDGLHYARNVVVATPVNVSRRLLGFERSKQPVRAHVVHVRGDLRPEFRRHEAHLFHPPATVYAVLTQPDRSVVVYARQPEPDLDRFFQEPEVIARLDWNPAEFMIGHELLEAERGDGLYMIGDYNVGGLEATFITGVWAANQVLAASQGGT